jgi:hypothetical protein
LTDRLPELLDVKALQAELGVTRAACQAIVRRLPVVEIEGLRKTYVRRRDVSAYWKRGRSRRLGAYVIASLALKPSSVRQYIATLRLLLDFAGVDPNPARDGRVRLPRVEKTAVDPPSAQDVEVLKSQRRAAAARSSPRKSASSCCTVALS